MFIITHVPTFATKKALKEALKAHSVNALLSVGSDSKTIKGQKLGYTTAILYMMPNDELCPAAKMAGCREGCLVSAGRAGIFSSIGAARSAKSELWNNDRNLFFAGLISEIRTLAAKHGDNLVIRLNGTSDIAWEDHPLRVDGVQYRNIFALFPDVQFYDYTKRTQRAYNLKGMHSNYHLTLSYSGARITYARRVLQVAQDTGINVAVVFRERLPVEYAGLPVLCGDSSDLRHLDKSDQTYIIGLKAKGKARRDMSGFVI